MKTYVGVELQLHHSLYPLIEGWIGPRAELGVIEKRKICWLCRESKPGRPDRSLVAIPIELSRIISVR
jgi:hypothetical protein